MPKLNEDYEARELARLRKVMASPAYWRDRDHEVVDEVTKGFEQLYSTPTKDRNLADAKQGQIANQLGLNGTKYKQDAEIAHLTPGEIVIPLSAQTPELMKMLFLTMGQNIKTYTVGSDYQQINPESVLPSFADQIWWQETMATVDKAYTNATKWHFEDRNELNSPLPNNVRDAKRMGFFQYPDSQSILHNNNRGKPEKKFGHKDGREVIFDGDTKKVENSKKYRGSYNYNVPTITPDDADLEKWYQYLEQGRLHLRNDVLPWQMGGNVRGEE